MRSERNRSKPVFRLHVLKLQTAKEDRKIKEGLVAAADARESAHMSFDSARRGDSSLNQIHSGWGPCWIGSLLEPDWPWPPFTPMLGLEATSRSGLDDVWITRRDSWALLNACTWTVSLCARFNPLWRHTKASFCEKTLEIAQVECRVNH